MVRLADLSPTDRENMLKKVPALPRFERTPWAHGAVLSRRRIAIVTTAGIHSRRDRPFVPGASGTEYRVIAGDAQAADLVMSHVSVNFDRAGFQRDWNVVFPLDRLRELADEGYIGSVADLHYSFMGAISPVTRYEAPARELAAHLKADRVDGVLLSPV